MVNHIRITLVNASGFSKYVKEPTLNIKIAEEE